MEEIEKRISEINKEMEELVEKAKGIAEKQQEAQVREREEEEEEERRIYLYPLSLPFPQDQLKEYEETLEVVKGEIEEEQKQLRLLNEQLVDLNHEKSQYTAKVKENRQKIKHFENEVIENVLHLQ